MQTKRDESGRKFPVRWSDLTRAAHPRISGIQRTAIHETEPLLLSPRSIGHSSLYGKAPIASKETAPMNYEEVGANIRAVYRDVCPRYREDDEVEVTTENHRHYCEMLREITTSFDRPISVLDVGCGTGRYFHCLKNVDLLIGLDISPEMLKAAESPVR